MRAILIRLPNWLGDVIMARPMLHAVRQSFPTARVTALGPAWADVLDGESVWNERLGPLTRPARGFEAALILPPSFSSAWRLAGCGIPRRIGFAAGARSWLLSDAVVRPPRGTVHLSEEMIGLAARLGACPGVVPALAASETGGAAAGRRLEGLALRGKPYMIVAPGARFGPAKRWPAERFVAVARRLAQRGWACLVCGDSADRPLATAVAEAVGRGAHALAGETSLAEQVALCAGARVTLSNDSGLAHLAAASGAPTVTVFGSTSSAWTAPRGTRATVVQRAPVCAPCFKRTCAIGYRCLSQLGVDAVLHAVERVAA